MISRGRPLLAGAAALALAVGLGIVTCGSANAASPPSIAIDPDSGPAGTTIKVVGKQFCAAPCTTVTITVGTLIVGNNITVKPNGTFSTFVQIPGTEGSRRVDVKASQRDSTGALSSATAPFYVTPELPAPVYYPPPTDNPALPGGAVAGPGGTVPGAGAASKGTPGPSSIGASNVAADGGPGAGDGGTGHGWWWGVAAAVAVAAAAALATLVWRRRRYAPAHRETRAG